MKLWFYGLIAMVMTFSVGDTMAASATSQTIYIFRHAEKVADKPDPELSEKGLLRAIKLADALQQRGIQQVYATKYKRTQLTAKPLADRLALTVETYPAGDASQLIEQVRRQGKTTLIIGHSNMVPDLVRAAGGEAPELTEKDYGDLFEVLIEHEPSGADKITTIKHVIGSAN